MAFALFPLARPLSSLPNSLPLAASGGPSAPYDGVGCVPPWTSSALKAQAGGRSPKANEGAGRPADEFQSESPGLAAKFPKTLSAGGAGGKQTSKHASNRAFNSPKWKRMGTPQKRAPSWRQQFLRAVGSSVEWKAIKGKNIYCPSCSPSLPGSKHP